MGSQESGIAAAPAAGVKHKPAREGVGRHARLDQERRLVFLGPGHIVSVPLPAEARRVGVGVAGQARNLINNRKDGATGWTR